MANFKRPSDVNQLAKLIGDIATGQVQDPLLQKAPVDTLTAAAAAMGRRGGQKGGPARAKALSPERRSEIARNAAKARWNRL
ncbi:hypothetical protein [Flaviaesturariibacter amylovorans]|uniref:Histone H1 n=1 Tax=Flaviaesturariibacter amylovorans TaxID=1084520 RepID=A0ABP8HTS8_9BACT